MLRNNSKQEINRALLSLKKQGQDAVRWNSNLSININYYGLMAEDYYNRINSNYENLVYLDVLIEKLKEGLNIERQHLIDNYNDIYQRLQERRSYLATLREARMQAAKERDQAKADYDSDTNWLNNWKRNSYQPAINAANARIAEYESEIADLRSEISRLNTELNSLISNRDTMRQKLDSSYSFLINGPLNYIYNIGNPPPTISQAYQFTSPVGFTYNGIYYAPGAIDVVVTRSLVTDIFGTKVFQLTVKVENNTIFDDTRSCRAGSDNDAQKLAAANKLEDFITSYREQAEEVYDNLDQEIDSIRNEIMADEETMYDYYDYISEERSTIDDWNDDLEMYEEENREYYDTWQDKISIVKGYESQINEVNKEVNNLSDRLDAAAEMLDDWNDKYWTYENGKYKIDSTDCPGYNYSPREDDDDSSDE